MMIASTLLVGVGPAVAQGWSQLATTGPSIRQGCDMARELHTGNIVLFGGLSGAAVLGDTWVWGGGRWTQVTTSTNPPMPRDGHAMAAEPTGGAIVLFGGQDHRHWSFADTWLFDSAQAAWLSLPTPPRLTGRRHMRMVSDLARGKLVMFGGSDWASSRRFNETWEFDLANGWVLVPTVNAPSPRDNPAMSFDIYRGVVVLHGGQTGLWTTENDTWEYDGVDWTRIPTASPPEVRIEPRMAFSPITGTSVLFGGHDPNSSLIFDDVWEWDGALWRRYALQTPVFGGVVNGSLAPMANGDLLAFGGTRFRTNPPDTWSFGGARTASVATVGRGCSTAAGPLQLRGAPNAIPSLGTPYGMSLTNASLLSAFSFSAVELPTPIDLTALLGAPGCSLHVGPAFATAIGSVISLPISSDPSLDGAELFVQGLSIDPSAITIATSNSLRLRLH